MRRILARKGPIDAKLVADINAKLKKIGDSYKPGLKKKLGESSSKAKGIVPSISTPASGVRRTRSSVKAADERMTAALESSRKGKGKQVFDLVVEEETESVEKEREVDDEEDDMIEDVEEVVPQSKKRKISQGCVTRSSVKATAGKFSKRTMSSKRTLVDENSDSSSDESAVDEESESEDEGDEVQKCVHDDIMTRKVLKGRVVSYVEEEGMLWLLQKLRVQGWKDIILHIKGRCAEAMVHEFFLYCSIKRDRITSSIHDREISFDTKELGELLGIPSVGYASYIKKIWPDLTNLPTYLEITRKFPENPEEEKPRAVQKSIMHPQNLLLFDFVNKIMMLRQEKREIASFMDLVLMELVDNDMQINWPRFMIHLIKRVVTGKKKNSLPFGFILTDLFAKLEIPLGEVKNATKKERFGAATLVSCVLTVKADTPVVGVGKLPLTNKVRVLRQHVAIQATEIKRLEEERDYWKSEATKAKEANKGMLKKDV